MRSFKQHHRRYNSLMCCVLPIDRRRLQLLFVRARVLSAYLIAVVQATAFTNGADVVITTSLAAAISTTISNALVEQSGIMMSNDATLRHHQRALNAPLHRLRQQVRSIVIIHC